MLPLSMEDNQWQDPLLLTDASWQEQSCHYVSWQERSFDTVEMADPDDSHHNPIDDRSLLGFPLTSPDLVICAGSPDITCMGYEDTPEYLKNRNQRNGLASTETEISLEEGITGLEVGQNLESPTRNMSALFPEVQTSNEGMIPEASLELLMKPTTHHMCPRNYLRVLSINAGGIAITSEGVDFLEDMHFSGGDVFTTDETIEDCNECLALYQSARLGNFSYEVQNFEPGNYFVDLHLAEIIFTDGPPGMRIFNVFIQEEKVVSGIDIYAKVGSNRALVLRDLKTSVQSKEGLSISFEGVIGTPIVCGISIRKDCLTGSVKIAKEKESSRTGDHKELEDCNDFNSNINGEVWELRRKFELQYKELTETKKALEDIKRENELKSKECQEAWRSLYELQNELMRKSMHVGSLAFAIEGQVKEKSQWFSSLRDLTRRFKILKMEHIKLSEEGLEYKKCLTEMAQMAHTIQSTMNQHVDMEKEFKDIKLKFIEGAKERKEIYNKVLELKGNIRVFCRCRPLNNEEIAGGTAMAVDFEFAKDGELTVKGNGASKKFFKFDSVFTPQANQADVFEDTSPLATSVLDGYNVCIFAYGQTGSGKTFTMEGTELARGVNYRTLEELFRIIKDRRGIFHYEISVSVLEVYNEQIRDLLVPGSQTGVTPKRLEIRQVAEGIHHVPGLVEAHVNNMNEVWEVLQMGSSARAVGSTNANEHSSRSHCIHCVMVKGENLINGECTRSKLWLVDLAGSERIAKTDVQGERLKETQNINRSLSALGDVIFALATRSPHIPFRNSKLTHLLQDSLGGDSKALMFVQISPNENDLSETLCSLNFASRVRGIELGPAKKQLDSIELVKYKQMVEKTKHDMKSKEISIKKLEETIHSLELKVKTRDLNNKNLQDKVKELESQLLIERKLARQQVDTIIAEQQQEQLQLQEQKTAFMKPPLATPLFGNQKIANEPASSLGKDVMNLLRPLSDNNISKFATASPTEAILKNSNPSNPAEKENRPKMSEQPLPPPPKRTGRASICTITRRIPMVSASRRNSLIPLPSPSMATLPSPLLTLAPAQPDPIKEDPEESEEGSLPDQTLHSLKGQKSGGTKKVSSILRRSIQKKIYIKSPLQQRRVGVNGGIEKVRVSIGGSRRLAQRVLVAGKEVQQKQSQREKERGWIVGSGVR